MALLLRETTGGTDDESLYGNPAPHPQRCSGSLHLPPKHVAIDAVEQQRTALRVDAERSHLVAESPRDGRDMVEVPQAAPIERVVKAGPRRERHPTVNRRHQGHAVQPSKQQAEEVGLVVVTVPDADIEMAAQSEQLAHRTEVERTAIGDGDEGAALRGGATLQRLNPDVAGGMEVCGA